MLNKHKHEMLDRKLSCKSLSPVRFPLSSFHWQSAGFVRAVKEDYKCRVFYYLVLKASYATTVIILTTVLFYKIIKDDETSLPESELAPSLFVEGSARCSLFPLDTWN